MCSLTAGFIACFTVSIVVMVIVGYGNAKWSWTEDELERLNRVASETQLVSRKAFKQVNEISDLDSKIRTEQAIAVLKNARTQFIKSGEAYDDVKRYFAEHRKMSGQWVHASEEVFELRGETFTAVGVALQRYYDAFEALLSYQLDNYDALQKGEKGPMKRYDALYSSCQTALDEYNQAYIRHASFLGSFWQITRRRLRRPEVMEYAERSQQLFQAFRSCRGASIPTVPNPIRTADHVF